MPESQSNATHAQPMPAFIGIRSASGLALEREVVALFDEYRNRLLAYVVAFGIDRHDSEEVVQEVFLSLFRHLRMGKSRSNLRGWIFRVAHNLALKQRKANQRWGSGTEIDAVYAELSHDPSPNPEERFLSVQRQQLLLTVFHALPEQDRWCLVLRADGLRYREIAEVLGISLGSVSLSLTRSFGRLIRADER